ncbi:ABC transporter substrate-binding protein [Paenibacillus methanolicus]|uniref:Putative spermidine/putrescine transport system substrate-binding protein n=1 Tax=Paenibacillus methanolicus TaxID=582686 RepID=A0A5S5BQC5_9BACL|nr:extracellular solute-binding protein [Paenibacillus methanolicus]TYP69401.1 putative spermidine/putrescine transport system substrate-binding protein [Paenibacillus methanolicus]
MKGNHMKAVKLSAIVLAGGLLLAGCSSSGDEAANANANANANAGSEASGNQAASGNEAANEDNPSIEQLAPLAEQEGKLSSVGMPDSWANWKDTWADLKSKYKIEHTDTDMSSAEELAKFEAEKNSPPDIGDVGIAFGPLAEEKGLTMKYKTPFWDEIPDWAKDDDGDWIVGYTGSISFLCNNTLVDQCPTSWADVKAGAYKVAVGDVTKAAQAQHAVLAAALAFGGDEKNLQPGLDFFAELAKRERISKVEPSVPNIQKGEVEVALLWDFNALGYRDQIDAAKFDVHIPSEGSVISGYATVINANSKNPNAAKLARAYILSDEGQINLAKGYARPIRDSVKLPDDVSSKLIGGEEYANAKPIQDFKAWENALKELPNAWLEQVQANVK